MSLYKGAAGMAAGGFLLLLGGFMTVGASLGQADTTAALFSIVMVVGLVVLVVAPIYYWIGGPIRWIYKKTKTD